MAKVFKYRGGDWSILKRDLTSLARNEIYAAPFSHLNDPFESLAFLDQDYLEVGKFMSTLAGRPYSEKARKADAQLKKAIDSFLSFSKGIGVYSMSKSAKDELLWAHYANSHRGFCVEFDLNELLEYQLSGEEVLEVIYTDTPPKVIMLELIGAGDKKSPLLQKLMATKSRRWRYEEELRICVGTPGFREYDYRALKAVYFGLRSEERLIRLTMRLLRGRGVKYYKMQLEDKSYSLNSIELTDTYPQARSYRARIAPVDEGVPYLDEKTRPFESEIRTAVELARREPYCERVRDAYISGNRGTADSPTFYVGYERSDGLPRNFYYEYRELRSHPMYREINGV